LLHTESANWATTIDDGLDLAFDDPDNVHVSPYGSLIIAEDGNTANHLLNWSDGVGTQTHARNLIVLEQTSAGGTSTLNRPTSPRAAHCCSRTRKTRPHVSDSLPLAAVLPDRARPAGAAPDYADEADHPLRVGRGRWVE
jgi:hypothetical protein